MEPSLVLGTLVQPHDIVLTPPPLSGVKSSLCSCAGGVRRSPVGLVLATVNSGLGRGG